MNVDTGGHTDLEDSKCLQLIITLFYTQVCEIGAAIASLTVGF
jgi:hypothetical protein